MELNRRACELADAIAADADLLRARVTHSGGARIIDVGVDKRAGAVGGLEAGRRMAEVCLSGLASVELAPGTPELFDGPCVCVRTDAPIAACLASQYAGWEVKGEGYFAMGSGPMRAAAQREEIFKLIGYGESPDACVGVLEASELPTAEVSATLAEKCGVAPERLTLLVAPTNSQAGGAQNVARSVETALHKLHELDFDLSRIESGWGVAPLPPVAGDALAAIGRTNDAILYGAHAVLYVRGEDDSIAELGPRTPSCSSADHGRLFIELFAAYDHDFYKIDKLLFSPAMVTFVNLDTGRTHRFGQHEPRLLSRSFGVATG